MDTWCAQCRLAFLSSATTASASPRTTCTPFTAIFHGSSDWRHGVTVTFMISFLKAEKEGLLNARETCFKGLLHHFFVKPVRERLLKNYRRIHRDLRTLETYPAHLDARGGQPLLLLTLLLLLRQFLQRRIDSEANKQIKTEIVISARIR